MRLLQTGTLSSVTGAVVGSGVSSPAIDLSMPRPDPSLGIWLSIEGDTGRTGGSVAVVAKGCYRKSGVTYAIESTELIKSGTSVSGESSNGSYLIMKDLVSPFMKLEAVASKAGVTNHGTGVTNACNVRYAVCAP